MEQEKSTINRVTISQILCVSVPELSCDTKCWLCPLQHATTCTTSMYMYIHFSLYHFLVDTLHYFAILRFFSLCVQCFFRNILFIIVVFCRYLLTMHKKIRIRFQVRQNVVLTLVLHVIYTLKQQCLHIVFLKASTLHDPNLYFKFRILVCLCVLLFYFFLLLHHLYCSCICTQINTHFLWFYL